MSTPNHDSFYNLIPKKEIDISGKKITVFSIDKVNIDKKTVASFSEEWVKF
jgi:hypothetical protein